MHPYVNIAKFKENGTKIKAYDRPRKKQLIDTWKIY